MKMKRWIALILSAMMLLSLLPITAHAVDNNSTKDVGSCPSEDARNRNNGKHHYFAEVSEPWCETSGMVWWYCVYCGDMQEEYLPPLGHDWGEWFTVDEPTCTTSGMQIRYCRRCQKEESRSTPPLGHNWQERIISSKDPTCLESGYREYARICSRCGLYDGATAVGTVSTWKETLPALGHDFGPWVVDEEPTCLDKGLKYKTCKRCGYQEWLYMDPLGHLWDDGVITRLPTPDMDGEKTFTCKRNSAHKYYEPIPYEGGPTNPPTPAGMPVGLELTMTKISPDKASYQLNDTVDYLLELKNVGEMDMEHPGFNWAYNDSEGQKVEWRKYSELGVPILRVDETVSTVITIPINQKSVDNHFQVVISQGFADVPPGAYIYPEQMEHVQDGVLYSKECRDDLPIGDVNYGLSLTVVQTSPAKPAYALGETVEFDVTLTNSGNAPLYMGCSQRTNVYTAYVMEQWYKTGVYVADEEFPAGDSFTGHCSYVIDQDDVDRTEVVLHFGGHAWTGKNDDPNAFAIYPETIEIQLLTKEAEKEYGLQLTVTDNSVPKPLYALDDPVSALGRLTNISDGPVEIPRVHISWVEENLYVMDKTSSVTLQPGEWYDFFFNDAITPKDVVNGSLTLLFEGEAVKLGTEEKVYSNDVTLSWNTTDEPPILGDYQISLTVTKHNSKSNYVVDGYGYTEEIPYHAIVRNIGDQPLDFSELLIVFGSSNIMHIEPTQRLNPGDFYEFDIYGIFLSEYDVLTPDPDPEIIGDVDVEFTAYGRYPDTNEDACSDGVFLKHTLVEPGPWKPEPEGYIMVDKVETSHYALNPNGYMLNEVITYDIIVTNISDVPVHEVNVWDVLVFHGPDQYLVTFYDMQPHESRIATFQHTVDTDDVARGSVINWAYVEWGETGWEDTDDVISPTTDLPIPGGLEMTKDKIGDPDNGAYYVPGEIIHFTVTVTNTMDVPMTDVDIYDDMAYDYPGFLIGHFDTMAPHESQTLTFDYTPDDYDADVMGYVANTAYSHGFDPTYTDKYGTSNTVIVPVHREPPKNAMLKLTKEVISHPANGTHYQLNETIVYLITAENIGEVTLYDIALYDTLDPSMNEFYHIGVLPVGDKQSATFTYVVTQADVVATYVENYAIADFWPEDDPLHFYSTFAGPVISLTAEKIIIKKDTPSGNADSCKLTLRGVGAYTISAEQHYCTVHKHVADQADALTSQGSWQQAADLWRKALEDEFDAIVRTTNGLTKAAYAEEKTAFFRYLDSYESMLRQLYPNDAGKVCMAMSRLMMDECSELCYLRNNPGKSRPDSMLVANISAIEHDAAAAKCLRDMSIARNGNTLVERTLCDEHGAVQMAALGMVSEIQTRTGADDAFRRIRRLWQTNLDKITNLHYRAASGDLRQAIGQNRMMFDQLMEKRADLLATLYPSNPAAVAEALSNMVRDQVLTLCEIW